MDWIELVNFKGNDSNVLQRGIELAAPTGADQDALAVKVKADGQHHRQRAGREPDATERRESHKAETIVAAEDFQSVAVDFHGPES